MKSITNFFRDIRNSFYNPEFYARAGERNFKNPFWLIVKLSAAGSLAVIFIFAMNIPSLMGNITQALEPNYFPEEFELVIEEGIADANVEGLYYLNGSDDHSAFPDNKKNFIAINTNSNPSLSEIEDYNAFFVITQSSLIMIDDQGVLKSYKFSSFLPNERLVIDKEYVEGIFNKVSAYLPLIAVAISIVAFILLTGFSAVFWLLILLLFTFITIILGRFKKLKLPYRNAYKISMYAIVPAIVVDIVTDVLFGLPSFSFLLIFFLFTTVIFMNLKSPIPQASSEISQ